MTSQRAFGIALIGVAVAMFLFIAVVGSHASAAETSVDFTANLQSSGYGVTSRGISQGVGISAVAKVLRIEHEDTFASVQLYEYPDTDALSQDWVVNPGQPAQPRDSSADVAGRTAFWNGTSVLLVDFQAPNDPELARNVGQVFLSQNGDFDQSTVVSSRAANETPRYRWERAGNVSYWGMSIPGELINVSDNRGFVQLQLFDYGSEAEMTQDWDVTQASPRPQSIPADSIKRTAYRRGNSVLLVGSDAPYNPDIASEITTLFLKQGIPTTAIIQPPSTGDADLLVHSSQRVLPVWAGLLWTSLSIVTIGFAGVGGVALVKAVRR